MKGLETGKDKVKKICDILRKETLEPARDEAEQIISNGTKEAEKIIQAALDKASKIIREAEEEIERQRKMFHSSITQACKKTIETLKQQIEEKLFNQELSRLVLKQTQDPKALAGLITVLIEAIEKKGLDTDLSVAIPAAIPAREVNMLLAKEILDRLKEKSVLLAPIAGGIELKFHKDKMTLDISDQALIELVSNYARKDFREFLFGV